MYDAIVVGAGPAGSYIASRLAQLGYEVLVLERKGEVGENVCCTGIISTECFSAFNLDATIFRQASSAKFFAPCSEFIQLYKECPQAYIVDRASLDRSLKEHAQRCGVDYLFSAPVIAITNKPDYASVIVDYQGERRTFTTQTVILACGSSSRLPEKLGLGKIKSFVFGAQAEAEIKNVDEVEVYFDQKLFFGFFGWLVPTSPGKGLAGLLVLKAPDSHLRIFLRHLQSQGKISSAEANMNFGTIPLSALPRTHGSRVVVVGDAAGQVKPTTGGGIYYGLLCADIAAETLHQAFLANDFSATKLSPYDKQWKAKLGRELQTGYWVRRLYKKFSNRRIDYLFQLAKDRGIPKLVAEQQNFSFDWHRDLIFKVLKQLAPSALPTPLKSISKKGMPMNTK